MTTVQHELRSIHNRIATLEQSVEQLDKEVGGLGHYTRENFSALILHNIHKNYSFSSPTDATDKQKAEKR